MWLQGTNTDNNIGITMLTLEERILRIELLTGIVREIPKHILDPIKFEKYRYLYGLEKARIEIIKEYFANKSMTRGDIPTKEP
jgi:hypothetical protein